MRQIGEKIDLREAELFDLIEIEWENSGKCLVFEISNSTIFFITHIDDEEKSEIKKLSLKSRWSGILLEGHTKKELNVTTLGEINTGDRFRLEDGKNTYVLTDCSEIVDGVRHFYIMNYETGCIIGVSGDARVIPQKI